MPSFFDFLQEGAGSVGRKAQKLAVDDPAARRALAAEEDKTVQLEQGAIRQAHQILSRATMPGAVGRTNAQLLQVTDALDKGVLKPNQVIDDLETLLKGKFDATHLHPAQVQGLASALNDLKVSQQQRASQSERFKPMAGTKPVDQQFHKVMSDEKFAEAKKLREEASNSGILNQGKKIHMASAMEGQAASLKQLSEAGQPVANNEIGPQNPPDLNSVFTAAGTDKQKSLEKLGAVLDKIGMVQNKSIHPGAFGLTLSNMMAAMGDAGVALMHGLSKGANPTPTNAPPKKTPKPGELPEQPDPYQARIEARQNDVMNAVSEIKNLKTFDSTWKVGLYILFSLIMGPAPAAMLFTNKARRGELKFELDALERDLSVLLKQQQQGRQFQETARHHAVMEVHSQERIDQDKYMDEEYLKLRRMSPRGKDPEYDAAMHGYRLQKDEMDEVQDVLNNQFDYSEAEIKAANKKLPEARNRVAKARGYVMTILNRKLQEAQGQPKP